MKTSVLVVVLAALACAADADQDQESRKRVFFKDVPRPASNLSDHGLRIYNGDVATRTQFPYQAGLYVDFAGFCGGSLIHTKWVLTAAHCVEGSSRWAVFLGVSNMLQPKQEGRIVQVTNWGVRHENFDPYYVTNDIGVIQLPRDVELTEYIALSKLAPAAVNYVGRMATVSGFGRVGDSGVLVISPVLKYTALPVVPNSVCAAYYESADVSQICLEAEGTSSCKGDSGGPLTVQEASGSVVQIGLTSFGCKGGCTVGCPVGFTRINIFYDWLTAKTGINFP